MLLHGEALASRWNQLVATAAELDIAVAWITSEQRVIQLLEFARMPGRRLRVITGVHDYLTSAVALRRLHENGVLRIAVPEKDFKFHPKLYIFTTGDSQKCWVGSANLTGAAFGGNVELVYEYNDDGTASEWFNRQWKLWPAPDAEWLDLYEKRATERGQSHPFLPQMRPPMGDARSDPTDASPHTSFRNPLESWPAYLHALRETDKAWMIKTQGSTGIYSGQISWVGTIRAALPVFAKDWAMLTRAEACILLGKADGGNEFWGQLGCMKGAGVANNVFLEPTSKNLKTRRTIQDALAELHRVPLGNSLPLMARKAHEVIGNLDGFKGGVATRLMALARPEVLISVNNESVDRLADWSGLPKSAIESPKGYEKLINWVMHSSWWNAPAPHDSLERELWMYRAALIDGFAYSGQQLLDYSS